MNNNPFIRVYDAVYSLLFEGDDNPLGDLVKINNRITFGTQSDLNRTPSKDRVTTADIPEIWLADEGGMSNVHANSSGVMYKQSIGIYCSTGDWRYGVFASIVNWYIFCNIKQWVIKLGALTWNGSTFVKNVSITSVQVGESNPERNRALNGWNCIWRIEIEHRIDNHNVVPTETINS